MIHLKSQHVTDVSSQRLYIKFQVTNAILLTIHYYILAIHCNLIKFQLSISCYTCLEKSSFNILIEIYTFLRKFPVDVVSDHVTFSRYIPAVFSCLIWPNVSSKKVSLVTSISSLGTASLRNLVLR